jgi:cytochrome c oxidase subunit 2
LGALALTPFASTWAQSLSAANCPPDCPVSFLTPSIFSPASAETASIRNLFNFILVMATLIFVVVEGLLVFAIFRFRNRPPEAAMQFHGNTKLELAWTAAPAVILAILMGFTFQTMGEVKAVGAPNVIHVKAIGHQWWWEFRYPDLNIVTANELVVPVNTVVEVSLESVDVEHGFWVPELFGKTDAVPGYTNRVKFTPAEAREYFAGLCTQFCGEQHAQMRFAVKVVTGSDYAAWVINQQQPPVEPAAEPEMTGKTVLLGKACVGCHVINGTAAVGQVGPNLTHFASRGFFAGGVLENNPANLKAWIRDPQSIKPGTLMPAVALTDQELDQIVAYLVSLK